MKDIDALYIPEIREEIVKLGLKPFAASQIFHWIHQKQVRNFEKMSNLSKENRELLSKSFFLSDLIVEKHQRSKDGTEKFLFKLHDGNHIETVLMDDEDRKTVCVSTQVGCPLGCCFCATGSTKFARDLNAAEIIGQVEQMARVNNVVFMGMGEPFLNYDNLMRAIRILNSKDGLNIGARKMTVSTAGIPDKIIRFGKEGLQVRLAVSLNAANNELRSKLMPINEKYPINELVHAIRQYNKETGRRVTFEYVMLKKINDNLDDVEELAALCDRVKANVNLIQLNPHDKCAHEPSKPECVRAFKEALSEKGIETVIRIRRGTDISAACGQLKGRI
ncbi:MAG: 23S rRNA (adenine(2503)-C(2))-methyltransferase RlmN [Candidatus Margulisiibacteriota bacterium]